MFNSRCFSRCNYYLVILFSNLYSAMLLLFHLCFLSYSNVSLLCSKTTYGHGNLGANLLSFLERGHLFCLALIIVHLNLIKWDTIIFYKCRWLALGLLNFKYEMLDTMLDAIHSTVLNNAETLKQVSWSFILLTYVAMDGSIDKSSMFMA
jgi:hypothetical protein